LLFFGLTRLAPALLKAGHAFAIKKSQANINPGEPNVHSDQNSPEIQLEEGQERQSGSERQSG
jgi:hypothetical protein